MKTIAIVLMLSAPFACKAEEKDKIPGNGSWICSPAGAGKKSECYERN